MAFTPEQEAVLLQLITAFQNGKRLSDLPDVQGTNPFNLLCEVLDEDGESKKAALAQLLPYVEDECSYGVEYNVSISSPNCTRIGNLMLHKSLPVQSRMKGCLLSDAGTVNEYLSPTNWTGQTRDGSRGQVMVELPMYYRKFETDGDVRRVRISDYPLPGYHQVKKKYVSAYEATVQRSTTTLASVANLTEDFRGGNNNSAWDGTYRSLRGVPATGISRTNFRNYARKRKPGSAEWNCMTYDIQRDLFWLYIIEYATLNSQKAFNAERDGSGFRQGGLGGGVQGVSGADWSAYNSQYPFVPCGCSDTLGNASGEIAFALPEEFPGAVRTLYANRYRGVENPFAHIWQWTDGVNVRISPTEANGGDNISKVYVCDDPTKFNDTNYDGYTHVGNEARADGYVKSVIFGEFGEIMPDAVGGGSTTYFCDYHYTNIPTTVALRGVLFGGTAASGAVCGFGYASTRNAPSNTDAYVGSRLCFIPA